MRHKLLIIAGVGGLAATFATSSNAQTTVDLSKTNVTSGTINGAIFTVDSTQPAGTGIFGRDAGGVFSTIQNKGIEEGYNTSAPNIMDNKRVPQWNHEITLGSLSAVTVSGQQYYSFLLDINESTGNNKNLLSLDDLKIFTTSATAITDPTISALMTDPRLLLQYNMDAGANNTVILDYDRQGGGSGRADMAFLVSTSLFSDAKSTDTVYLYSKFGATKDGDADAGFEEWTAGGKTSPIPEPGAVSLISLVGMGFLMRRRR